MWWSTASAAAEPANGAVPWRCAAGGEDPLDQLGLGNESDEVHLLPAPGTLQRVDLEDTAQQLGPPRFLFDKPPIAR